MNGRSSVVIRSKRDEVWCILSTLDDECASNRCNRHCVGSNKRAVKTGFISSRNDLESIIERGNSSDRGASTASDSLSDLR